MNGKWQSPLFPFVKLNIDATLDVRNREIGFGMILQDSCGAFMKMHIE